MSVNIANHERGYESTQAPAGVIPPPIVGRLLSKPV